MSLTATVIRIVFIQVLEATTVAAVTIPLLRRELKSRSAKRRASP